MCSIAFPMVCLANAGLSFIYIVVGFPTMVLSFLGIVPLEFLVVKNYFDKNPQKVKWTRIFKYSIDANIITTILGMILLFPLIPLIGGSIMDILRIDIPNGNSIKTDIFVYATFIISILLAFFMSVLIETAVARTYFKEIDKKTLKKLVWRSNILSYAFLSVFLIIYILVLRSLNS
ncbi:MAG: hypothetical protein WBC48_03235 [Minisyncoccales bacterium]